jgi:MFS family permease
MSSLAASITLHQPRTPLLAVCAVTFLASIGTGVVWNGVSFIAKHDYGFKQSQTLWLYAVLGVTYGGGALSTGWVLRALRRILSPRAALASILLAEAIVCASLYLVDDGWMLCAVACCISVLSSWLWPIIESYLTAGRHGGEMRNAIGFWNLSWTGATAMALVLMMPVMKEQPEAITIGSRSILLEPRMAIVLLGGLHAVAILPLAFFGRSPGTHDAEMSEASVQAEYRYLLQAARMLLPLSYVLNAAMTPLLPYLFEPMKLDQQYETVITSTWMWVRIAAMAIMWRIGFWHGRWGTLLLGGLAMTLGFGVVVMEDSLRYVVLGLAIFGTGMGIVYYAALYYAMAVGQAEVDAGGTHEALIGVGYSIGPVAGLVGFELTQRAKEQGTQVWEGAGVVTVVWLLVGAAAFGILKPYRAARKQRSV